MSHRAVLAGKSGRSFLGRPPEGDAPRACPARCRIGRRATQRRRGPSIPSGNRTSAGHFLAWPIGAIVSTGETDEVTGAVRPRNASSKNHLVERRDRGTSSIIHRTACCWHCSATAEPWTLVGLPPL